MKFILLSFFEEVGENVMFSWKVSETPSNSFSEISKHQGNQR